jgi:ribonuclease P/MRP protein subunit POP5
MLDTIPAERTSVSMGRGRGRGTGNMGGGEGKEISCVIRVVRVSGTIRKSEEELLRRARRDIIRARECEHGEQGLLEDIFGDTTGKGTGKQKVTASREEDESLFDDDVGDEVDLEDDD